MPRTLQLLLCFALAGLIAWAAARATPRPPSLHRFSAQAAMSDVAVIGAQPHPIGSPRAAFVRDYLQGRLRGLGLQAAVWRGKAIQQTSLPGGSLVEGGEVQDVLAVLPGRSRTKPALLVMAHYDTVPSSPGAADDSVGAAVVLQIATMLKAGPQPARDVVFLITDGEEAGLLGARAFFASHPLAGRIGAVVNLEAVGGGGPAYMFETGPANGRLIRLFARAAPRANADSLSGFVYSLLPNDTDFSIPKARAIAGLNFALIGHGFDYHAASSVPANVDRGDVQVLGDMAARTALAVAAAPALPTGAPDVVYGDLLGRRILAYRPWFGWVLLAIAGGFGLVAFAPAVRRERLELQSVWRGAAAPVMAAGLYAILATLARAAIGVPHGFVETKALLARFGAYETVLAAAAAAALFLTVRLMDSRRAAPWNALAGAYGLCLALAAALQAAAPATAHILLWPLLAAGLISAALPRRLDGTPASLRAVLTALPLAQLLHVGHAMTVTIGADLPQAPALVVLAGAPLALPLLWGDGEAPPRGSLGVAALVLGTALVLFLRLTDPYSPRSPRPTDIRYVADLGSGRFWRTSAVGADEPWTRAALEADGGVPRRLDLPPFLGRVTAAAARPVSLRRPQVRTVRTADGRLRVEMRPSGPSAETRIRIDAAQLAGATLDGQPIRLPAGARRLEIVWNGAAAPVLSLQAVGPARVSYADIRAEWPTDARPLRPRPANLMPWGRSDSTVQLGALAVP